MCVGLWHEPCCKRLQGVVRDKTQASGVRRRPLVFIAGDARRLGHTLDAVVSEANAQVSVYGSGSELLDAVLDGALRETAPDVLIVDDDLRGYGGLNMAASLRRAGYRTAIYVMTPIERAMTVAVAARRLSARVVQRPVTAEALLTAIERAELVAPTGLRHQRRDRRRWPRVPVHLVAELRDGHHCSYSGLISDVSLAGMMVHVEVADASRLRVGRSLDIAFDVGRHSVCLPAVVRRRGDPVGSVELGVRLQLDDSDAPVRDTYGHWLFARIESFLRTRARANRSDDPDEPADTFAQAG